MRARVRVRVTARVRDSGIRRSLHSPGDLVRVRVRF